MPFPAGRPAPRRVRPTRRGRLLVTSGAVAAILTLGVAIGEPQAHRGEGRVVDAAGLSAQVVRTDPGAVAESLADRGAPLSRSSDRPHVPHGARAVARSMVAAHGYGPQQFACLNRLWKQESRWRVHAANTSSGAYGIPQALPGSKMASAGPHWRDSARTQIRWGLGYIREQYGSPCRAWRTHLSQGWY